jgi:tripartite-type tricarboxylate transporter receptor subunit TctC
MTASRPSRNYVVPSALGERERSLFAAAATLGVQAAIFLALTIAPAAADPVTDFYAGKTVQVLIGYSAGGGYDLYARTLARFMGKHIPGQPTLVPQNMPGAGSLRAANYLYNVAPKDGTVFGTFGRGIAMEPLLRPQEGARFDATKFTWLGSITNEVSVCAFSRGSGIDTWQDMQSKHYVVGGTGSGSDTDIFPLVLRNMFHLPLKLVTGFPGGSDVVLALERHEIDGRCGWSWSSLHSRNKPLLDSKELRVVVQLALNKHEDLPDVPLVMDLTSDARQQAVLKVIFSRQTTARPFAAPPGIPADRAAALRAAFDATMQDPDFLSEAERLDLEVRPENGASVEQLIKEVYASSPDVLKGAAAVIAESPP